MPLLFIIKDKYYEGRISPSINSFLRNPIQIISAGETLVNKGLICKSLIKALQEIYFVWEWKFFMREWSVNKLDFFIKKRRWLLLTQFLGILIMTILRSYRNGSSSNFLFRQEMVKTKVNYFLLHRVV